MPCSMFCSCLPLLCPALPACHVPSYWHRMRQCITGKECLFRARFLSSFIAHPSVLSFTNFSIHHETFFISLFSAVAKNQNEWRPVASRSGQLCQAQDTYCSHQQIEVGHPQTSFKVDTPDPGDVWFSHLDRPPLLLISWPQDWAFSPKDAPFNSASSS